MVRDRVVFAVVGLVLLGVLILNVPAIGRAQGGRSLQPVLVDPVQVPEGHSPSGEVRPVGGEEGPWRIRLVAFPDTVGIGGYDCPGCDGTFSSADQVGAAYWPLSAPLHVIVHAAGDPSRQYWNGLIRPTGESSLSIEATVVVDAPPPYEVTLLTPNPLGYTLCPNAPATHLVTQDRIDGVTGTSSGEGRDFTARWFFWSDDCSHG